MRPSPKGVEWFYILRYSNVKVNFDVRAVFQPLLFGKAWNIRILHDVIN